MDLIFDLLIRPSASKVGPKYKYKDCYKEDFKLM